MHVSVLRVSAMGLQNFYIFNYQNIADKRLTQQKNIFNFTIVTERITTIAISTNSQNCNKVLFARLFNFISLFAILWQTAFETCY